MLEEEIVVREQQTSALRVFLQYTAAVIFVVLTGVVAYLISKRTNGGGSLLKGSFDSLELEIQILGWTSAICYGEFHQHVSIVRATEDICQVVARVPQICEFDGRDPVDFRIDIL